MSKLPRLRGRQVIKALAKAGFQVVRVRGSHHFLQQAHGRVTVVPIHAGEIIGPGLLNKILSDCDLTKEDLDNLL